MDRFLIADNPMSDNGTVAIVHTADPVAIIEVMDEHYEFPAGTFYRHFDYEGEAFTFRLHHLFTTGFDSEQHHAAVDHLFSRAWRWWVAYLKWEDKSIDNG